MKKNNQHVIPLGTGWAVKKEGSKKFTIITDKKADALKVGRQIARNQNSELFIHGSDGKIQDKDSYGKDPHPPKDKRY